jgi:hypothetical protein
VHERPSRRTLLAGAVGATAALAGCGATGESQPSATFEFDWDPATRELVVRHAEGDRFDSTNSTGLELLVDGAPVRAWSLPVEAGDELTVEATPGAAVTVRWVGTGGETTAVGDYEVPDGETTPPADRRRPR